MKIGVISDTHYQPSRFDLNRLTKHFKDVSIIMHAGDVGDISILKYLSRFGEVNVVAGNNDYNLNYLNKKEIIKIDKYSIGLTHGHIGNELNIKHNAYKSFNDVDIIIYGHTHRPSIEYYNDVLMINPGSLTRPRTKDRKSTVAILYIDDELRAEIVEV
ncbi:MAG: metallophosphoesterase family protein [Clostridia bacterium]